MAPTALVARGLAGALASAVIIGAFERQLEDRVLLAFLIPGVVYMAAAIGTQTQAVLIRGFAVGVTMGQILRRELVSGVVLSLVVSAAFLPVALIGWGDGDIALGVTLALFASSVFSTLVAIAIPLGFQRLGKDPAFGSGPLATVLQDLLTIGSTSELPSRWPPERVLRDFRVRNRCRCPHETAQVPGKQFATPRRLSSSTTASWAEAGRRRPQVAGRP